MAELDQKFVENLLFEQAKRWTQESIRVSLIKGLVGRPKLYALVY